MSVTAKSIAPLRDQSPSNMTASYWLEAMNEVVCAVPPTTVTLL